MIKLYKQHFENWFQNELNISGVYHKTLLYEFKSLLEHSWLSAYRTIYEIRVCKNCVYYTELNQKHCTHHVFFVENENADGCNYFEALSELVKDE